MGRAHRDVEPGQRGADQVDHAGPVGDADLEDGRPRRRLGADCTTVGSSAPAPGGRSRAAGSSRPVDDRLEPLPQRRLVEVRSSATSQTEPPTSSCAQARAARTETRCSANIAAASASRPDPVAGRPPSPAAAVPGRLHGDVDTPRVRDARRRDARPRRRDRPARRRRSASSARRPGGRGRATRPARHVVHALGEVARASASVSAASSVERLRGPAAARRRSADGRRVLGVAAWWRSRRAAGAGAPAPRPARPRAASKPIRVGDLARRSAPPPRSARSARPCRCRAAARPPSARRAGPPGGSARTPRCRSPPRAGRR